MKNKNWLPYFLLGVMVIVAVYLKKCNQTSNSNTNNNSENVRFSRNVAELYFTKHARCRMKCRSITQKEVREILAEGTINYNKSNLQSSRGAEYALEGTTSDRQHVRIIFSPKKRHMTVVTVIDLDKDWECPSCD